MAQGALEEEQEDGGGGDDDDDDDDDYFHQQIVQTLKEEISKVLQWKHRFV
jgi:hypothetical protein